VVVGRNLAHHLERLPDRAVVGVSRRAPDFAVRARFVSVDLLDRDEMLDRLAGLGDATHLFYCAFQPRPTWAKHNAPNLAMLVNPVEATEIASARLQRQPSRPVQDAGA
jgi:nucleoside-diphosphate-sugar epimerase